MPMGILWGVGQVIPFCHLPGHSHAWVAWLLSTSPYTPGGGNRALSLGMAGAGFLLVPPSFPPPLL